MRSRPWIGAGAVLALLGPSCRHMVNANYPSFSRSIRDQSSLQTCEIPQFPGKEKQSLFAAMCLNEAAFNSAFAQELARIVGADFVVNETQAPSAEHVVAPEERIGTVTIPVNTYYDDSPESLKPNFRRTSASAV